MTPPDDPPAGLTVMISGGFALAYEAALPDFTRETGLAVRTLSGASQGRGPRTIRHQLAHGASVDVVILSNEGLHELTREGLILAGSAVELATAPLAAAMRTGAPVPAIDTVAALTRTLAQARRVAMPGSTSGLFIRDTVFPRLGLADTVRVTIFARGTESAAALAAGEADLALGPVSELVDVPGITVVGPLPDAVQLVQTFTAAIVAGSGAVGAARRLIAHLASDRAAAAIRRTGMEPVAGR
ncbi:substrate-binding domain-containing protein [Methylobacterium indicum]|uniref:Molybdenum ABC transporter substrate-binding protein n=1 Tax=Methylobacterium indicum TaxID=1775910 RepID=A0A8H8WTU7_9HYPH|nr:substrate-binding domain-containing protein [Methylobacterium indicum]BCM84232.1 molybdenum ABC transporter substrate-binding protein [Methylobacterium indicum]